MSSRSEHVSTRLASENILLGENIAKFWGFRVISLPPFDSCTLMSLSGHTCSTVARSPLLQPLRGPIPESSFFRGLAIIPWTCTKLPGANSVAISKSRRLSPVPSPLLFLFAVMTQIRRRRHCAVSRLGLFSLFIWARQPLRRNDVLKSSFLRKAAR